MLTVLGGLAEFESELIKARTMEGRERAKRAGVQDGAKAAALVRIRLQKSGGERLAVNWSVLGSILWREPEYDITGQISSAPTPAIEASVLT